MSLLSAASRLHASRLLPLGKEGKDLLSVPVACHLSSANSARAGTLLVLCKCEVNLPTGISSLRSRLACFISHLMKLRVSTKIIALTWVTVALPLLVDRARMVPGLWDALPLLLMVKLVTHQLAPSQRAPGYQLRYSMGQGPFAT